MAFERFRQRLKGREFWRNINRGIGIGLYSVVIVGIMAFPTYLIYVFFGMAVIVPSYVALFINHLRKMEKRDKGNKIIEGWITHAYGVGERIYLYPTKFELVEKLSPDDVKSVKQYVKNLEKQSKKLGLEGFKRLPELEEPKSLEYKKIEDMNRMEKKNFDDDERKEYEGFAKEHKTIIVLEKREKEKIVKPVEISETEEQIEDKETE